MSRAIRRQQAAAQKAENPFEIKLDPSAFGARVEAVAVAPPRGNGGVPDIFLRVDIPQEMPAPR